MGNAATRPPPPHSTIPLTTYKEAVQERDELVVAAACRPAFEVQLREAPKQCEDLQVRLLVAERRATIAQAERDLAFRNKGSKGMREESKGADSSSIEVAGPGLGNPSTVAGISRDFAQFIERACWSMVAW